MRMNRQTGITLRRDPVTATVWLTVDEVTDRTTLLEPEIKKLIAAGEFPSPLQGEDGARVWRETDIDEWIESRPRAMHLALPL